MSPVASSTRDHAAAFSAVHDNVHHLELVKKGDLVLDALLIERLKDHVPGPVRGVAGPAHGRLAEIPGVSAEPSLIDAPVGCTVEGQSPVFEIVHGLHGLLRKDDRRVLVHEIVPALDRVEGMPFGFVLFHIAQRGADSSLGRTRVAPDGVNFRKNGGFRFFTGLESGIQPRSAGPDDHGFEFVYHIRPPFLVSCD